MSTKNCWEKIQAVAHLIRAFDRLHHENVILNEKLTAAQADGTRWNLGRQRARALLREVLDTSYHPPKQLDDLHSRIVQELGSS
jgi:hypothetical protein